MCHYNVIVYLLLLTTITHFIELCCVLGYIDVLTCQKIPCYIESDYQHYEHDLPLD